MRFPIAIFSVFVLALISGGQNFPAPGWKDLAGSSWGVNSNTYLSTVPSPGGLSNTGTARTSSIAMNSLGNPVVAWTDFLGTTLASSVRRWNGSTWEVLGNSTPFATTTNVYSSQVLFISGKISLSLDHKFA